MDLTLLKEYVKGCFRWKKPINYSKMRFVEYFERLSRDRFDSEHIAAGHSPFWEALQTSETLGNVLSGESLVIVDLGAGFCDIERTISFSQSSLVVSIDLSRGMLVEGKAVRRSYHHGAIVGDVEACPLASSSADLVFLINVLPYLRSPLLAFSEIARILKPGGKAFVLFPIESPIWDREADGSRIMYPPHKEVVALAGLVNLMPVEQTVIRADLLPAGLFRLDLAVLAVFEKTEFSSPCLCGGV